MRSFSVASRAAISASSTCRWRSISSVRMRRSLAVYISDRDMAQLFIKSIETKDIRDAHGVPFQIFYGISDNSHAFWSIVNAREVVDYQPQDNSERRFYKLIAEHIEAAGESSK